MNESTPSHDGTPADADGSAGSSSPRRSRPWRSVLRVGVTAVIGFVAVATVHQVLYEPTSADGSYEWTLRWPGMPPGANFKTERGDDCRRLLEILLADAGPDWKSPLIQQGTVEVRLSRPAYPSLWTILKWRFGLLKGSQGLAAERTVLTVRVNRLTQPAARYEVVRIKPDGAEAVRGTFETFDKAQSAVLDELAQAMEQIQA